MNPLHASLSASSTASLEIGDFTFCSPHAREECKICGVDFREDNTLMAGLEWGGGNGKSSVVREGLVVEYGLDKVCLSDVSSVYER